MDESEQGENRGIWDGQDLLGEGSGEQRAEVVALGLPPVAAPTPPPP
jgi:hypothetical protein